MALNPEIALYFISFFSLKLTRFKSNQYISEKIYKVKVRTLVFW